MKTWSPKRRPISEVIQSKHAKTEKRVSLAVGERVSASQSSVYCSDFGHINLELAFLPLENEVSGLVFEDRIRVGSDWSFHGVFHDQDRLLYDKVTVLESEKRAYENSPEAQAIREALNPWRNRDAEASKES